MGLDIFLHELVKPSQKEYKTEKEFKDFYEHYEDEVNYDDVLVYHDITDYSEEVLKGLNPEYICEHYDTDLDWETIFKEAGLNEKDYEWYGCDFPDEEGTIEYSFVKSAAVGDKETADAYDNLKETDYFKYIATENSPRKTEKRKVIFYYKKYDCYMRKGPNKQFYVDGMWEENNLVFSKAVLEKHRDLYFSHDTTYYSSDEETRKKFQEFIDNFVDGKTFVGYF